MYSIVIIIIVIIGGLVEGDEVVKDRTWVPLVDEYERERKRGKKRI